MKSESKLKANATRTFLALIIFGGAIAALFYAYTQQQQREDLEARVWKEKSTINEQVLNLYQEIETNLAEITAHENVIRESVIQPKQEGYYTPQEKIQNEIKIIEVLLAQNKDLIASLNSQIGAQDEQLAMYTNRVDNLTGKVSQYKKQLALFEKENEELKTNLADSEAHNLFLNNEVETKTIKINEQMQQMDAQQQTLQTQADKLAANEILINTAYYVVGTYPDLREAGIVEKSGSIIGLGGTKVLADDFDRNKFVKIDLRNYTIIPVNSKKAELVSDHRISSYEWVTDEKGIMWLKINDPETFWESSKYMVIVTKDSPNLGLAKND